MTHFELILLLCWLGCSPLGYLATRWSSRTTYGKWTRNDRFYAIVFSLINGPLMIIIAVAARLICDLEKSERGNQDARW